jgi:peroxiredoxin|tara:strand:+ start:108 stop:782 length:675 start_codon:yes stop_codon:yes gene_type:complete
MTSITNKQIEAAEAEWLDLWKQGPTRLRWTKVPLQVGDLAPDFELKDISGKLVHLRDFWSKGPALILFWRHYGCSCGVDRAKLLQSEYADYIKLGASVVVIGQGEPERSRDYSQKHSIPCPVLCDPTYQVYEAYDLLEGKPSQIIYDAPDEYLRIDYETGAQLQQSRQGTEGALVDSPWQLPGEFVVDQSGIIRLAHRYQHCEDWPNPSILIPAIKESIWQNEA